MPKRPRIAIVLTTALATAALTSCGTSASGGTFDHAAGIVTALEKEGVTCPSYAPIETPAGAAERGQCWLAPDNNVIVSVYATEADADAAADKQRQLGVGVGMLTGENWTLTGGGVDFRAKAHKALGGELVEEN